MWLYSSTSAFLSCTVATLLLQNPTPLVSALGINCRGSGLCPMATWDNKSPLSIMQVMRDAIHQSKAPDSTPFNNGDHVLCVSDTLSLNLALPIIDPTGLTAGLNLGNWNLVGNLKNGGICLFPQYLKAQPLTLGMIRKLVDKLLEHGCGTCGSIPVHFVDEGSNDPGDGILTFNYVRQPYCTDNCLTDGLVEGSNITTSASKPAPAPAAAGAASTNNKSWNGTALAAAGQGSDPVRRRELSLRVKRDGGKVLEKRDVSVDGSSLSSRPSITEDSDDIERRRSQLSTRSAKFVDLTPRVGSGEGEVKGWIGWLMRRL